MSFDPSHRDYATFVYYCCSISLSFASFLLTIVLFVIGSIYLKNREEKVQQLKELSNKKDQQRKEWRRFTEKIRRKHRQLKAKGILSKISNLKGRYESVRVFRDITGTDVLRFRINDLNFKSKLFQNPDFDALCDGLDSVYMLLNKCASLLILDVPENSKEEIGKVVADLGKLILPFYFYEEEERDIIAKCLEHFKDCGRPTCTPEVEDRDERGSDEEFEDSSPKVVKKGQKVRLIETVDSEIGNSDPEEKEKVKTKKKIKQLVPYVDFLELCAAPDGCWKFKLHLKGHLKYWNLDPNLSEDLKYLLKDGNRNLARNPLEDLKGLLELLENGNDSSIVNCSEFLSVLKTNAGELTRDAFYANQDPNQKEVLHYVRKYLHKIVNERKNGCEEKETENVKILLDVYVSLRDRPVGRKDEVKIGIERLIQDLTNMNNTITQHPADLKKEFYDQFCKWHQEFQHLPIPLQQPTLLLGADNT